MAAALAIAPEVGGLGVRDLVTSRHQWLWSLPDEPVFNGSFQITSDPTMLQGVGFPDGDVEWHQHLTMVSPIHFVAAGHYMPTGSQNIRFVSPAGGYFSAAIAEQVVIFSHGEATDLMLGTLTDPIDPAWGFSPYPVLNLATQGDYVGKTLLVVGKAGRAGNAVIGGFERYENSPGFDATQFCYFDYPDVGGPQDIYFEGGYSGSPSFVIENGALALVGVHSDIQIRPGFMRNFDAFVPEYMDELDAVMESEGFHLTRYDPEEASVGAEVAEVGTARRGKAGSVAVAMSNPGTAAAHNIAVELAFSAAPGSVSGAGWVCKELAAGTWSCRRGGVEGGAVETLTAEWAALPMADEVTVGLADYTPALEGFEEARVSGLAASTGFLRVRVVLAE